MQLYFSEGTNNEKLAIVHVQINQDFLKFDVDLGAIPQDGTEVVVDFKVRNFINNKTFYTDSNGLEMQERILNYRPTWNFDVSKNLTVSSNYYPVTQAI